MHLVQEADHIVILDQGRIVQQGTFTELANNSTISFSTFSENTKEEISPVAKEETNTVDHPASANLKKGGQINYAYSDDNDEVSSDIPVNCICLAV